MFFGKLYSKPNANALKFLLYDQKTLNVLIKSFFWKNFLK